MHQKIGNWLILTDIGSAYIHFPYKIQAMNFPVIGSHCVAFMRIAKNIQSTRGMKQSHQHLHLRSENFRCRFQYLPKKCNIVFQNEGGGGGRGCLEVFQKFIQNWTVIISLAILIIFSVTNSWAYVYKVWADTSIFVKMECFILWFCQKNRCQQYKLIFADTLMRSKRTLTNKVTQILWQWVPYS